MSQLPTRVFTAIAVSTALLCTYSATAHHSSAMFDHDKVVSAEGVVRTWQFSNPHATLWVYINDTQGKPQLWGIEAPGPNQLVRSGWDKDTVKPGDKVTVSLNPLRDGRNGGNLVKITLSDGRTMGLGGGPGGAGPGGGPAGPGAEPPKAP
ncbi:MAG: DUF6152 family protein [Steroidobacteraceae bacterium]